MNTNQTTSFNALKLALKGEALAYVEHDAVVDVGASSGRGFKIDRWGEVTER